MKKPVKADICAVILTYNEAVDLPKCLRSLQWTDTFVLDSGSTDGTQAIANDNNARLFTNDFAGFGQQRNFAIDKLGIETEWILFLDADEIATPAFVQDLERTIALADDSVAGFYCCWRMMLEERWLKRCDNFPKWQFRVVRSGRARFKDFGHGQKEDAIDGVLGYIKTPYDHYAFSKGWSQWISRHNKYSTEEAKLRLDQQAPLTQMISSNSSLRNASLKLWVSKLPGWPLLRFFQGYILKLGVLEGMPGFIYCVNIAYYEFLIKIKMRELKRATTA